MAINVCFYSFYMTQTYKKKIKIIQWYELLFLIYLNMEKRPHSEWAELQNLFDKKKPMIQTIPKSHTDTFCLGRWKFDL